MTTEKVDETNKYWDNLPRKERRRIKLEYEKGAKHFYRECEKQNKKLLKNFKEKGLL